MGARSWAEGSRHEGALCSKPKGWRQRGDALPRLMDGRTDETDGDMLDAGAAVATTERAADPD